MMSRWQYQIVNLGSFSAAERMAQAFGYLGSQGWELVAIYDKASNWIGGTEKGFAIFKKEVADDAPEPEQWGSWAHAHLVASPPDERRSPATRKVAGACKAQRHNRCAQVDCGCHCHSET